VNWGSGDTPKRKKKKKKKDQDNVLKRSQGRNKRGGGENQRQKGSGTAGCSLVKGTAVRRELVRHKQTGAKTRGGGACR